MGHMTVLFLWTAGQHMSLKSLNVFVPVTEL